jgi:peptidylprolyl isomerase
MANIKYIIITLVVSALLVLGIGLWVGQKTGELALNPTGDADLYDENLPGPLDAEDMNKLNPTTDESMENASAAANPTVTLKTNKGDIAILMYQDLMPITVGNFIDLAEKDFYDGIKFHRVIEGFMIQGGDPNTKGDNTASYGTGGPGYTIQDEFVADAKLSNVRGTISMANTGQPNSGGSQFFINLVDNVGLDFDKEPLSSRHPVFGRVVGGMDVVDAIGATPTGMRDLPNDPVIIEDVIIDRG